MFALEEYGGGASLRNITVTNFVMSDLPNDIFGCLAILFSLSFG